MTAEANSRASIVAATATGTGGILVFALLPVLIGQLSRAFDLSPTQAGTTASAYFVIYALISLTTPLWIRRFNWRMAAAVGYTLSMAGITLLMLNEQSTGAAFGMAIAGAGGAILLPISLTLVSDMRQTERMYAVTIAAEQLVPAVLLLMLGAGWLGAYTLHTTLTWSLAVILLCVFASIGLPAATQPALTGSQHGSAAKALAALVGLATSFAGFAAMWAFFEIIGVQAGLSESFSAQWIAVGLLMTAAGPIAAAWVGNRWGRILPTSIPILIAVLAAAWLSNGVTSLTYATALVLFPLGYYFALNYFMSIVASADANGRFSSLMAFALALGAIGGPAVFGYLREVQGPAFAVMALLLIGSTLGFGAVQKSLDRTT